MSENRNFRRGSLVWPILLIGLGLVFLLNNLGFISWNIWSILVRMWPVILVAIGLDLLLGRRSGFGAAIAAMLIIGLFAGFFWAINTTGEIWSGSKITESIVHELGNGKEAVVDIDLSVGDLFIESLDKDDDVFVRGDVTVAEDERLAESFTLEDGEIRFSLSSRGQQYYPGWLFTNTEGGFKSWRLSFSEETLLDLNIDSGVGRLKLDLTNLILESVDVSGGVGEVSVYLPAEGRYDVNINTGVGKIDVYLPEGLAAKIYVNAGLGNASVIGNFSQRGDMYISDGFEGADHQVTIILDGGVGNIRVVEVSD
jgi:hypothetical protein